MQDDLWAKTGRIEGGARGLKIVLPRNSNVSLYGRVKVTVKRSIRKRGLEWVGIGEVCILLFTSFTPTVLIR